MLVMLWIQSLFNFKNIVVFSKKCLCYLCLKLFHFCEPDIWISNHDIFKIVKNIEELKQSVEEKASAIKKAEEGAADLKSKVEELSKSLEEHEKEYQVKEAHGFMAYVVYLRVSIILGCFISYCLKLFIGCLSWQKQW